MDKLLSVQQVADGFGMHPKTLYKLLRENRIALNYVRLHDRMIAFRPSDVEDFINEREVIRTGEGKPRRRVKKTKVGPVAVEKTVKEKLPKYIVMRDSPSLDAVPPASGIAEMFASDEESRKFFNIFMTKINLKFPSIKELLTEE